MAKKFSDLKAKMSPAARAEVDARVKRTLKEMPLTELRNARELTQTNLAAVLGVPQGTISKIEKRTDMYLSTLRSYVEAMGGRLEIRAVFPDGAVVIDTLHELSDTKPY